jgi:hypothetical protein
MTEFEHSYALVVGINNYTNGIAPLQTAQPDAKKLAAILQDDHHYQVTLITDDTDIKPTHENLLTLLENPFPQQQLTERDRLLFYFAEALFEALAGGADIIPRDGGDGVITATELYLFLRESVELRSQELQTPGIWTLPKHERGEYIFLVPNKPKNLAPTPELNQDNNPYRGLEPFDEKHSRFFFGRQELIQELAQRLSKPDHRLTVRSFRSFRFREIQFS